MLEKVVRDAAVHELTAETVRMRDTGMVELRQTLAEVVAPAGSPPRVAALLDLILDFTTWQSLVRRGGLSQQEAVDLAVELLGCVRSSSPGGLAS
jgi:hypothetical protein